MIVGRVIIPLEKMQLACPVAVDIFCDFGILGARSGANLDIASLLSGSAGSTLPTGPSRPITAAMTEISFMWQIPLALALDHPNQTIHGLLDERRILGVRITLHDLYATRQA